MAAYTTPAGSPLARQLYSVESFARLSRVSNWPQRMTGPTMGTSGATASLSGMTTPSMPIVRMGDLSKGTEFGDTMTFDFWDTANGEPLMGDSTFSGNGEALTSSSDKLSINLVSKIFDGGGQMTQKRQKMRMDALIKAQMEGWWPKFYAQSCLCHAAGARGSQTGRDWVLGDPNNLLLPKYLINPLLAPTYNRHLAVDQSAGFRLVPGSTQVPLLDSTDVMSIAVLDALALWIKELDVPMQYVKLPGDAAADDQPICGIVMLTQKQWWQIQTEAGDNALRKYQAAALARANQAGSSIHPLFRGGDAYFWNGLWVMQQPVYNVSFAPGETMNVLTQAACLADTPVETQVTVPAGLAATGMRVDRAIVLSAQALGYGMGDVGNGYYYDFSDEYYDIGKKYQAIGQAMMGIKKLRGRFRNRNGQPEWTDYGMMVVDSVVPANIGIG